MPEEKKTWLVNYDKQPLSIEQFSTLVANRIEFYNRDEVLDILFAARDMLLDLLMEGESINIPKLGTFTPCSAGYSKKWQTYSGKVVETNPKFSWKVVRHQKLKEEFHKETVKTRKHLRLPTVPVSKKEKKGKKDAN